MSPAPDVLGTEPGSPLVRRTALLVCAALALGTGLVAGDRWQQHRELAALVHRAGAGRASVAYADRRIAANFDYVRPELVAVANTPEVRASIAEIVHSAARDGAADLRHDRQLSADTRVLSWHHSEQRVRTAYVAYLDARIAYLDAVGKDLTVLYDKHPDLARRLADAQQAFLAAAPGEARRVRAALADDVVGEVSP